MDKRGEIETLLLKENITDQRNRLLTQLDDLEELRDEMTDTEYEEERIETLRQLESFQAFLDQTMDGNMTLVEELSEARKAIQAAIKTTSQLRVFIGNNSTQLRSRLETLKRNHKLKSISTDTYNRQVAEVLLSLRRMGEVLTAAEEEVLETTGSQHLLAAVSVETDSELISTAAANIVASTNQI